MGYRPKKRRLPKGVKMLIPQHFYQIRSVRQVIPYLMSLATGSRYIPEWEWNLKSLTFTAFRVYEQIFGRVAGIRFESYVYNDGKKCVYYFNTAESALIYAEGKLRAALDFKWKPFRIYIPIMQTPQGVPVFASPYLFAIAYDNAKYDELGVNGTNLTTSFVCGSGSSRFMFIGYGHSGSNTGRAASYAGSSATMKTETNPSNIRRQLYVLVAPASGTNNAVLTCDSSTNLSANIASYSGVAQNTTMDAITSDENSSATTLTLNQTTTANNCWQIAYGYISGSPSYPAGLSQIPTAAQPLFRHTNGALTPAGSYNRTWTLGAANIMSQNMIAFAPLVNTNYTQTVTETMTLSDAKSLVAAYLLSKADQLNLSDLVVAFKAKFVEIIETITLSDVNQVVTTFSITQTETITIDDESTTGVVRIISVQETMSLSDNATEVTTFLLTPSETMTLGDDVDVASTAWSFKPRYGSGSDWVFKDKNE